MPPIYKMPPVEAGMNVMWSPGNGAGFTPGIVTKVGVNSITIALLRPGATSFVPKDSVRHRTDPGFARLHDPSKTGCWDYTDQDALLGAMAAWTLGKEKAKELYPGLAYLIDAYTPPSLATGSYSDDDPDVHGA